MQEYKRGPSRLSELRRNFRREGGAISLFSLSAGTPNKSHCRIEVTPKIPSGLPSLR